MTAANPATDFQALGRQVWEAWSRQWAGAAAMPAAAPPMPGMDGLRSYLDWMQQAAAAMMGQGGHAFPPIPDAGWAMPGAGAAPFPGMQGLQDLLKTPAFGYTREQQAEQQALLRAMLDHQQAGARYQQLIARAQVEGAERMRRRLAEPGFEAGSLKAMYDLWVDCVEEVYAEIALSDEFREAYAAQVNTQMRVRQLQQKQVEQWCRELGLPTRGEVATLGQRLQELRREMRRMQAAGTAPAQRDRDVKTAASAGASRSSTHAKARRIAKADSPKASPAKTKARPAKAGPSAKTTTRRAPRRPR